MSGDRGTPISLQITTILLSLSSTKNTHTHTHTHEKLKFHDVYESNYYAIHLKFIQCVCVYSVASVTSNSPTLWTIAHQAPLSMGFSRHESCSGLLCLPPGDLPDPGIKSTSPALQANSH